MSAPLTSKPRSKPFVLKPYAPEAPVGLQRILPWIVVPLLVFICLFYGFFYALTTPYLIPQFSAPLAILLSLAIWALPDLRTAPTRTLDFLFFAFLISTVLWPNYLALSLPGLPWITAIRLFGFPLAFVLLICVSVSKDFRSQTLNVMRAVPGLWQLTAAFIAINVFSVLISDKMLESMNIFATIEVNWTVIFFASCYLFLKKGNVERWAVIMWVSAMVLCFVGVEEAREGHVPWAGHIPSFLKIEDPYVQHVLAGAHRIGTDKYRVQGTHSTSLGLAEYFALCTPFVIHFMVGPFNRVVKVLAGLSIPFIFYTIVATDARLGVVGFFIACLLYLLYWGLLRWRQVRGTLMGPAVVLTYPAVFVTFMAATFFVQRLHKLVWGGSQDKYSNQGRVDQMNMGIPKILSHPWGYGLARGGEALNYHNPAGDLTVDTYYLMIALDYGVLGFLVYYGTILLVIIYAARFALENPPRERERTFLAPLMISLTAFFIIKSIFSQTDNHSLVYMMMGMVAALVYRMKTDPETPVTTQPTVVTPRGR
jgi:O-antigen ligase